ncbi:Lariat debranching enzyme, C-terminal domain [Musa troglodytarum]|uniref:Lariat debranching enzyme, C-terminal domain n=1 Tax=Musa troglodytarum TaxID=320322 RepID=A0A9E7HAC6_9LILI|nr:Lariat debranching enzyme, C-terminal domain [Musa troglodytarum]
MKIAVEGCLHGEMDKVYDTIRHIEKVENIKIDLLICCGDFQAVRNENDLESLSCPPKYRSMNSFWKYYSGQEVAPVPTIFIGGNHEASNYLWELYYGGWAAPNIYFLGFSGVIKFGNIRIGGVSGIYKQGHYHLGKFFFSNLIRKRTLGSLPAAELLNQLKPHYWFSGHLHCNFAAVIQHRDNGSITKFLALDKCLPGRKFLQIVDVNSDPGPYEIQYDEEWLAITRKFNSIFPSSQKTVHLRPEQLDKQDYREWVRNKLITRGARPFDFVQTVSPFDPSRPLTRSSTSGHCRNPQTESLLQLLELPYLLDNVAEAGMPSQNTNFFNSKDAWNQLSDDGNSAEAGDVDELEELAEDEDGDA